MNDTVVRIGIECEKINDKSHPDMYLHALPTIHRFHIESAVLKGDMTHSADPVVQTRESCNNDSLGVVQTS